MYQAIMTIQCVSILLLLVECWIIFRYWGGRLHSCLFFACVATLINNVGYLQELLSTSEEGYITALRFSYMGRVWIPFSLLLFVAELVGVNIPAIIRGVLALLSVITYVILFTTDKHTLYYTDTGFFIYGDFPYFIHRSGVWHRVWDTALILYITVGLALLVWGFLKAKSKKTRLRFFMVILAIFAEGLFSIIQIFKPFAVNNFYDMTMIGFSLGTLFMLIAIFRFRLLDTENLAREYIIDELSEGIFAVDENGTLVFHNKPALELFPEIEDGTGSVIDRLSEAVSSGSPIRMNDRIYSASCAPLSVGGDNAGTLYSLSDDTDHYNYMEQLEEQKRIADDANKAKSTFLANMSHEIRTPINAVLGMDEMIMRESREKNILSYAHDIRTAGRTLLSLINDILDFSKIEEGRMEILPTQYELSSLIGDVSNMIRERARKKGLSFEIDVDSNIPYVLYGDDIRIRQIALNLLTNAVKYTEEGFVRLELGYEKCSDDEIDLKISISDSGIGMKESDMDSLFSPFERIEEDRNRNVEGTGLGMSIVRQLLALMDSSLKVESEYGKGSSFSFSIRQKVVKWSPVGDYLSRYESEISSIAEYHELFHASDASILVVDDTEVNLDVIRNLLKKTLIDVDNATSGREALVFVKRKKYDIVFIDHMMPELDGIETLKLIKEEIPDLPVCIALTANAVSGAREMYLNAGFADYLSKPVDGKHLEELIRSYLPKEKIRPVDESAVTDRPGELEKTILVVDDDEVICTTVRQILGDIYRVENCMNASEAVSVAEKVRPALILLDINMSGMNGFEVFEKLKEDYDTEDIPVMFITADEDREKEVLVFKNGASDLIRKPFSPEVLIQRCKHIIELDMYQKNLQGEVARQTDRAERINREMMLALSRTVDAKDHYTNGHSERVAAYSAEIAKRMGKSAEYQDMIYGLGLVHDIGKIGIPEEIINKTEKLTDEEFARIKQHTVIGYEILKNINDMPQLRTAARSHHEKYDGSGYPDGLAGEDIPEVARIICVADCYDAMTSTRTYSQPKDQAVVRAEIIRCKGKHFDPVIADVMVSMIDDDKDFIMNERGGIPGWLTGVSEINIDRGISNCGDIQGFLSVLKVFHQTAGKKADEIEELFSKKDIEAYTIKVHALKSSARIIGAGQLSELAADLESAGKSGNAKTIEEKTPGLIEMYRALDKKLEAFDEQRIRSRVLSSDMRAEAILTISEIAESMDYGMMEELLNDLKKYDLSADDRSMIEQIEDMLMKLDWDGIKMTIRDGA